MLTVVAPTSTTRSTTSARKSSSVRAASSGENSTSSQTALARWTASTARRTISSLAILSLNSRWMELVARKTWMRGRGASRRAAQARSMSSALQRARPQMTGPVDLAGDGLDRLEVAGRGDGEAGLDHVHAEFLERVGDLELFGEVHAGAGRLFAVAECGVEDDELAGRRGAVVGHEQGLRKGKNPGSQVPGSFSRRRRCRLRTRLGPPVREEKQSRKQEEREHATSRFGGCWPTKQNQCTRRRRGWQQEFSLRRTIAGAPPEVGISCFLVPKLCLGTHVGETPFRVRSLNWTRSRASRKAFPSRAWERGARRGRGRNPIAYFGRHTP